MSVDLERVVNSRLGLLIGLGIGRLVPGVLGYKFANFLADRVSSRRKDYQVRAARANQWVVSQGTLSSQQLDQVVRDTFRHTARCMYDLFHNLNRPRRMEKLIVFHPMSETIIAQSKEMSAGLVIVGVHLSNFDFVIQAAAQQGLRAMGLALPDPRGAVMWQNRIRERAGMEIVPASVAALRQAVKRLRDGGFVLTGIDRPVPGSKYHPNFFGRPSSLPVFHIIMALKAEVPIVVGAPIMRPDGVYEIMLSDMIPMQSHPDRYKEIMLNAEKVLEVAENFIRQAPHQWAMFHPVWPEALEEVA